MSDQKLEHKLIVLVIEDEPQIRRFLRATLETQGYTLLEATTGRDGLTEAVSSQPELILLDLGLPDMDGLEVIQRLREWCSTPIIVISARGQERDKVAALDAGADDYLTKPFGVGELTARLRVALRRASRVEGREDNTIVEAGELKIDLLNREIFLAGKEIHLTPIEFKLLSVLVRHAGKVLTHRQLIKDVWGPHYSDESQNLRVAVYALRHKIELDPAKPQHLITEAGVGYRLRV